MSYIDEIEDLKVDLYNHEIADQEDGIKLVEYIERLEHLLGELSRKTGFADDYTDTWRGYITEEY